MRALKSHLWQAPFLFGYQFQQYFRQILIYQDHSTQNCSHCVSTRCGRDRTLWNFAIHNIKKRPLQFSNRVPPMVQIDLENWIEIRIDCTGIQIKSYKNKIPRKIPHFPIIISFADPDAITGNVYGYMNGMFQQMINLGEWTKHIGIESRTDIKFFVFFVRVNI